MSCLSRYWRHQWVQLPDLILNLYFLKKVLQKYMDGTYEDLRATFLKIVNNILLRHVGHIRKFELYLSHWVPLSEDISQWIQFLSSKGVQELTLTDCRNDYFVDDSDSDVEMSGCLHGKRLPSCLFSSASLKHLTLNSCCIYSLPSTVSGFPCLISLYLRNCCMVANTLQTLISSSPQLESLGIYDYHMCLDTSTIIYTPNLRELVIRDFYCDIRFQGNKVSLNLDWQSWKEQAKFFSCCFYNVETLILGEAFWRDCLLKDGLPIPNQLGHLKSLKLVKVPIQCRRTMSSIISLLGNCQKLQKLQIIASRWLHPSCRCKHLGDMVTEMMGKCSFRCLNNAALICMTGLSHELQLIKLLLVCSPVLEVMTIEPDTEIEGDDVLKITKELLGYSRASTNAKIIFNT